MKCSAWHASTWLFIITSEQVLIVKKRGLLTSAVECQIVFFSFEYQLYALSYIFTA